MDESSNSDSEGSSYASQHEAAHEEHLSNPIITDGTRRSGHTANKEDDTYATNESDTFIFRDPQTIFAEFLKGQPNPDAEATTRGSRGESASRGEGSTRKPVANHRTSASFTFSDPSTIFSEFIRGPKIPGERIEDFFCGCQ